MEYRTLNLVIVNATGIKNKPSFFGKNHVYAVASITGTLGKPQKLRTSTDKHGGSDPTWNFPMKFTVNEAAGLQNRLTLVVKIKSVGFFGGKNLGEVHVPVKELLEGGGGGVKDEGVKSETMKFVSYQVRKRNKPKGVLSFRYEFGERFTGKLPEVPVTAYPAGYGYQQQQAGYGYQQQQAGYGQYAPAAATAPVYAAYPQQVMQPPPVVQPQRRMGGSGMGFGTGLLGGALGGMLLGEIISDAGHGGGCGGGGCGGGGCGGGGCGGGGCGGF